MKLNYGPGHGTIVGYVGGRYDGKIEQSSWACTVEDMHEFLGDWDYTITDFRRHADDGTICCAVVTLTSIVERGGL
jgi:hypothetical protein